MKFSLNQKIKKAFALNWSEKIRIFQKRAYFGIFLKIWKKKWGKNFFEAKPFDFLLALNIVFQIKKTIWKFIVWKKSYELSNEPRFCENMWKFAIFFFFSTAGCNTSKEDAKAIKNHIVNKILLKNMIKYYRTTL